MTASRTVTVPTSDHGPVTIPEPAWCTGASHRHGPVFRADIHHDGEPATITVDTTRGPMALMSLYLNQNPFVTDPDARGVNVIAVFADGDSWPAGIGELGEIAGRIIRAARLIVPVARRLDAVRGGEPS
ncbi:DUF6907 domain-containing protein [Streptomyces sp. NPDC008139]|uniref:DUF6907 domain-containing protein n=1 Tax=Streptomyces sp. NPDC008139 TaxID=3364814 RepID=UPI0036F12948